MMVEHKGLPILLFASREAWREWLAEHGTTAPGLWMRLAKKGAAIRSVGKAEAIETAIAHGWVDGQIDRFDDASWLVRFTPRGPRSNWSEVNRETARRLIREGGMTAAGLAAVDKAKVDGRWERAYAPQSRAEVPDDLRVALDAEPAAAAFFASLKGANRYAVLYRIHDARTAETRAARIRKFVAMLARGETVYPRPTKASAPER